MGKGGVGQSRASDSQSCHMRILTQPTGHACSWGVAGMHRLLVIGEVLLVVLVKAKHHHSSVVLSQWTQWAFCLGALDASDTTALLGVAITLGSTIVPSLVIKQYPSLPKGHNSSLWSVYLDVNVFRSMLSCTCSPPRARVLRNNSGISQSEWPADSRPQGQLEVGGRCRSGSRAVCVARSEVVRVRAITQSGISLEGSETRGNRPPLAVVPLLPVAGGEAAAMGKAIGLAMTQHTSLQNYRTIAMPIPTAQQRETKVNRSCLFKRCEFFDTWGTRFLHVEAWGLVQVMIVVKHGGVGICCKYLLSLQRYKQ